MQCWEGGSFKRLSSYEAEHPTHPSFRPTWQIRALEVSGQISIQQADRQRFISHYLQWFDKSLYTVAQSLHYGQVKAFTLQSDAFRQYDASIFKNFSLPGESVLSFRAEFFNLPNTTSFNAPSSTIDATTCRTVTATSIPLAIFSSL